jgi:hypothetical protein
MPSIQIAGTEQFLLETERVEESESARKALRCTKTLTQERAVTKRTVIMANFTVDILK